MFSSLINRRAIAFDSSDDGARGAASGGATVTDEADEVLQTDETEGGGKPKDGEAPKDDRPEWRKRLDAVAETMGKKEGEGDGKPAASTKPGKPVAPVDDDETKPLLVKVPGRHAGDEDIEIPIDRAKLKEMGVAPKEARDLLAHMRNNFARKQEIETGRSEIAEGRAELDAIVTEMREKPVDFFLDNVTPTHYQPLVTALISRMSDADFAVVVRKVAEYDADGSRRRTDGAAARDQQHDRREKKEQERSAEQKRDAYVKAVTGKINAVIPESWDDAKAEELFEYATFKLQTHAKKTGSRGIAPDEIPGLLKSLGVLSHFGIEEPDTSSRRSTPPSGRTATPPKKPSGTPRDTAADLEERRNTRRNASTTPGGAGAAASAGPPKGQTFAERIKFVRDKFGIKK